MLETASKDNRERNMGHVRGEHIQAPFFYGRNYDKERFWTL